MILRDFANNKFINRFPFPVGLCILDLDSVLFGRNDVIHCPRVAGVCNPKAIYSTENRWYGFYRLQEQGYYNFIN